MSCCGFSFTKINAEQISVSKLIPCNVSGSKNMSTIKFFLFGKFRIEANASVIQRIETRKAEELLVYLLLHRDQPCTRERLADVLWGEISPEQSKSYLRKALWQLQSVLESVSGKDMLLVDAEWLQLNQQFECWLDIAIFEKAFNNTKGVRGKDIDHTQTRYLQGAIEMYRGRLLEGWYQDWCLYERERLQYLYLAMLDKLMDYCEAHGDYEKGLVFGQQILHYDRAHERTHRWLMRLHYLAGDRTSALRQYQKCAAILQEELDVEPAESTHLLYEMIRKGKLDDSPLPSEMEIAKADKEPLKAVLNHLSAFHKELDQIQTRLAQDMRVIHETIKGQ